MLGQDRNDDDHDPQFEQHEPGARGRVEAATLRNKDAANRVLPFLVVADGTSPCYDKQSNPTEGIVGGTNGYGVNNAGMRVIVLSGHFRPTGGHGERCLV